MRILHNLNFYFHFGDYHFLLLHNDLLNLVGNNNSSVPDHHIQ